MDEIFALQKMLAQVQEDSSNMNKISERVIVEIVDKIMKTYDLKLYFSNDGQDYMTPESLDVQIYELLLEKGIINILELPDILTIGVEKIESRIDYIQQKYKNVFKLNDQLMSKEYLDGLCEQINEELHQKSQINLGEISLKYNIAIDFLVIMINQRLGTIIQDAVVQKDYLTTVDFQQRLIAKLRGIMRGVVKPMPISSIQQQFKFDCEINEFIEKLSKDGDIDGKIQSGIFIPARFQLNQEKIVLNFFKQNNFIEYNMLQKQLFITKPKEFLKNLLKKDCIILDSCCYSQESLDGLRDQLNSLLSQDGYLDLVMLLPSCLSDDDIETLVNNYLKLPNTQLENTVLFQIEFLEKCTLKFKDQILQFIQQGSVNKNDSKGKKTKSNDSDCIFTKEQIIQVLLNSKLLDHADRFIILQMYFNHKQIKIIYVNIFILQLIIYQQIIKFLQNNLNLNNYNYKYDNYQILLQLLYLKIVTFYDNIYYI